MRLTFSIFLISGFIKAGPYHKTLTAFTALVVASATWQLVYTGQAVQAVICHPNPVTPTDQEYL